MRTLALLLALPLLGCPTDDAADDDDSAADDGPSGATVEDVVPLEGTWSLTLVEIATDSCDLYAGALAGDSLGTSQLTLTAEGFTMVDSDEQTFDCTVEGAGFDCTARPWEDQPSPALFPDATIHREGERSGTFTSPGAATTWNVNTDVCVGSDCPSVEQARGLAFPCTVGFGADAAR